MDEYLEGSSGILLIALVLSDDNQPLRYQFASICEFNPCMALLAGHPRYQGE